VAALTKTIAGHWVSCSTCAYEIPLLNTRKAPREFSALCPNCGERRFYQADQVHGQKEDAELNTISRRGKFGMKSATGRDRTAAQSPPRKSRFKELASRLIQ
jgi:hypothetical protein